LRTEATTIWYVKAKTLYVLTPQITRPGGRFRKMVEGQLAKASIGAPEKESPRDEEQEEENESVEAEAGTEQDKKGSSNA
jgi:hypothetical protein